MMPAPPRAGIEDGPGRYWAPGEVALPEWWAVGSNSYYCGLIARQLRVRAADHRAHGNPAAAAEAEAIADIVEEGRFEWLK